MKWDEARIVGRHGEDTERLRVEDQRRYRRVPPAITPVRLSDITSGISGHLTSSGRDEFRETLVSFLDAKSAGSYTSFRRALCASLLEISDETDGKRSEVLIPAFCSSDFPDAIDGAGLNVRRYDIDPDTMSLDVESVRALPTDDAAALVVVNVLGYSSPMEQIEAYCRENGIYLIEALGYALGSEYRSRRLGTFGDCSVLNFQQGKPIPVGGGMVVSRNDTLEFTDDGRPAVGPNTGVLSGYAAFGHPRLYYFYSRMVDWLDQRTNSDNRFSTHPEPKFDIPYAPPFATLSDFQSAVALRIFDRLDEHQKQRASNARFYTDALADCPHVRSVTPVGGLSKHQHVRYPIVVDTSQRRERVQSALSERGVQSTTLYDWPPIDAERFPGAARLQDGILTLPTHPYVTDADRHRIIQTVWNVMAETR